MTEAVGGPSGRRLWVRPEPFRTDELALGDSVSHNGVCLTVTERRADAYSVDLGPETLERTTARDWRPGHALNLERSLTPSSRMGGHFVLGHVDECGTVEAVRRRGVAWDLDVAASAEFLRLAIPRGCVAVDGISLTITGRSATGFSLSVIPHTWAVTSLAAVVPGTALNLEADMMARYVDGLVHRTDGPAEPGPGGLTPEFLAAHGFGPSGRGGG